MSGGALGSAAAGAIRRPTVGSVTQSTFLLAGTQALGILLEPTGVKRATFNDFAVNPGEASDTVPYIAGTVETTPHLITYFDFHSKKVKNDTQVSQMLLQAGLDGLAGYIAGGGHFGGPVPDPPTAYLGLAEGTILGAIVAGLGQLRTASYRYYCGFLYGICHGPIDSITAVKVDERIVSNGAPADTSFLIDDPSAWGGDHVDGGVYAICDIISGKFWPEQLPNSYLVSQVSNAASYSGKAMFMIGGFTRAPESGYFAATPQGSPAVRPLKLRVKRLPNNLGVSAYHDLNGDANIAECCYEWLTSPVFGVKKLSLSRIDLASFQAGAQTHFNRGVGISLEMNSDTDVESALEKFTELGGSIIYGSFNSGTIRYKVIERDYSIPSLPVFRRGPDGSPAEAYNVIRREAFTPGSWANTANDFAFDYLDRDNNYLKTTRYVQDVANRMLTGRVKSLSQRLEGVSNGTTAAFVGTRELRAGAYPRPPLNIVVNREGYQREPGDVIKYIDNVDNFVKILRITEVQKLATDSTAEILLSCIEDQYGVGAGAFSPFVPAGFHLTLHLHLDLADDYNGLGDASATLPGLADAVTVFTAVHLPKTFSDTLQSLTDAVVTDLRGISTFAFSDSINNLSDSLAIVSNARLTESLSDDINNLSDAVATSTTSVTPDSIANLELWLKADAITGLNDGDLISTWNDSSGNSRNATSSLGNRPTYKSSGGANNLPYVQFDGVDDQFDLPNFLGSFTAGEQFVVVKLNADPSDSLTGAAVLNRWGTAGVNRDLYPDTDGIIYDGWGSSTRKNTVDPTPALTSWRVYGAITTSSEWTNFLDGSQLFTTATNTVSWSTAPRIGVTDTLRNLNGQVEEIIFYSRKLSSTERQTVYDYLEGKYGITLP